MKQGVAGAADNKINFPGPDEHFLINAFGLLFDEITASNLVKVDIDGTLVDDPTGLGINYAGYVIQLAAEQQLEAIRRQVVKEITSAYLTANSNGEKISASRLALASAQLSRLVAEKALSYGMVNAVDVLTSVRNEFRARRDLFKTQYEFVTNVFALNRWAGRAPAESVESVNGWLNPGSSGQDFTRP